MAPINLQIPVFMFKEGNTFVAYTPALDLSSCGSTLEEAQNNFKDAVSLFLNELEEMGTLDKVLVKLGWKKLRVPSPSWQMPVFNQPIRHPCSGIPLHILKTTQTPISISSGH